MKASKIKCRDCEKRPAFQHYLGMIPAAVLCKTCGRSRGYTPVLP